MKQLLVITFMATVKAAFNNLIPTAEWSKEPTSVETIPANDGGLQMTVNWGTKTLTYNHKDEKGKRTVASVDVLSISTTLTGPLVENGLYFSYAMLDK